MQNVHSLLLAGLLAALAPLAQADEGEAVQFQQMQITATREPEPVARVPASITVVSGEELRGRGVNDLRTALSLVAGVEGTPGGDAGPAGAVPALWGLREQDSYLLVVDGVPWGGAFNPATPSIDFTDVARIEILRGAAPVMFGATSFNGVIHVIHYAAGSAPTAIAAGGGSHGSAFGAGSVNLPALGGYRQSLAARVEKRGYSVDRENYERYHLLYRGAAELGFGRFHADADIDVLPQKPGNVIFRNGSRLRTDLFSLDANHNPADAKLDQQRYHLALGFDAATGLGQWTTTLAFTRTFDDILRGFLRNYAPQTGAQAGDPNKPDNFDADGYSQQRRFTDLYFDTHLTAELGESLNWTGGVDYLHGKGTQNAVNFGYFVSLDGRDAPSGRAQHPDEFASLTDERNFLGVYTQLDWKLTERLDLLAGLRLNHTRETRRGRAIANDRNQMAVTDFPAVGLNRTRLSGVIGASWSLHRDGRNSLSLYADYRNTYKPLAVDFGPEAQSQILQPETANSYEAGLKGSAFDGRYEYDLSGFWLDFRNALTFGETGRQINGGKSRFQGFEYEGRFALAPDLKAALNYAYHDSRFKRLTLDDGTPVDGNRMETSPYDLASAGLLYLPTRGFNGSLIASYAGPRQLTKRNNLPVGGYTVLDASLGYSFGAVGLHLNGYNLTDRRVPVAESELAEKLSGASSYYLLPARSVLASVSVDL